MNQNQMQKRQELNQKKADAGLVSERFPQVASLEIKMTYYQRTIFSDSEKLLMLRTVKVFPESFAYFDMQCMKKECEGGFDLSKVISGLVKNRKKKSSGKIYCSGDNEDFPTDHASVQYEIAVQYSKARKKSVA